jgi:hypothetical protein
MKKQQKNSKSQKKPVVAYVAKASPQGPRPNPLVRSDKNCAIITHTEAFTSVVTTGTSFAVSSFSVNPGVASCFPWLAPIGARYETYKFRSLTFRYRPQAATSAAGKVILAFDFDAADDAPSNQFDALSYHDSASDVVWNPTSLTLDLGQGDRSRSRYTRVGLPGTTYDIKTLDLGRLHVCTEGAAAATLGIVEVAYVVELYTPQIQGLVGGLAVSTSGMDATHLFGALSVDAQGAYPFSFTSQVATFNQRFEGIIWFEVTGTGLTASYSPVPALGDCSVIYQVVNGAGTKVQGCLRVQAFPGTTLTPTVTATTVTNMWYAVGSCSFYALG